MKDLISNITIIIRESEYLLKTNKINAEDLKGFKKKCVAIYILVLNENFSNTTNELAKSGMNLKIMEVTNPIFQWIYNLVSQKYAQAYNSPFLTRHGESDNNKKYVFWTKRKLEGILFNLNGEYQIH